jgi:hypothetical protein
VKTKFLWSLAATGGVVPGEADGAAGDGLPSQDPASAAATTAVLQPRVTSLLWFI